MKMCVAKGAAGAACSGGTEECADGLYCTDAKKCAPQVDVGGKCSGYLACRYGNCENGTCVKRSISSQICR
jgi:hypothetical protein